MNRPCWLLAAISLAGFSGCTDRSLFRAPGLGEGPIDNKLSVSSSFCTEDPTQLEFPVKIIFAVDKVRKPFA